jgi:hypothetical protein
VRLAALRPARGCLPQLTGLCGSTPRQQMCATRWLMCMADILPCQMHLCNVLMDAQGPELALPPLPSAVDMPVASLFASPAASGQPPAATMFRTSLGWRMPSSSGGGGGGGSTGAALADHPSHNGRRASGVSPALAVPFVLTPVRAQSRLPRDSQGHCRI